MEEYHKVGKQGLSLTVQEVEISREHEDREKRGLLRDP